MITLTDLAVEKILQQMQKKHEPKESALRIAVTGRGREGFVYDFSFLNKAEKIAQDIEVEIGELSVFIDAESVEKVKGAKFDYMEKESQAGIRVENPNPLWPDNPLAEKVQELIDRELNPAIAGHGGYIILIDVKDDQAIIEMGGGCQGCGMAHMTLRNGVETMIKYKIPEIKEVVDQTDHSSGTNPYFEKPSEI